MRMTTRDEKWLPFNVWWPLLAGALVGVALRLAFFTGPGESFTAMSAGLLLGSPLVVGAVTVFVAERTDHRSWTYYMTASALANALYVVGTLVVFIEGIVCAIVVLPLFMGLGALGGVAMGAACRLTNWPKKTLSCFVLLPFVVGLVEDPENQPTRVVTLERNVTVAATPQAVWGAIMDAPDIGAEDVPNTWLYRMGLPTPAAGVTDETPEGPVRRVRMRQGIYFDEVIDDLREPTYVRWRYRFHEDSFPHGALDEHVAVGGHYFDFVDTAYELRERGAGTVVTMRLKYRLTTPFNWYAAPVAAWLFDDLMGSNLEYYRRRAEQRGMAP
jgi:hypothetical protein